MIEIWDDLVGEILVRLPVKSLLRFKCVDKRWNDLFRKPTFANRNMKIHEKKKQRVMIRERDGPPRFIISENDEILELDWQNPFPDDRVIWTMEFGGTYNGIFFIRSTNFYLWNPTTSEIKLIPTPPFLDPPPPSYTNISTFCGFGGDPDTSDYKVLYIVSIGEQIPNQIFPDSSDEDDDKLAIVYTYLPTTFELYNLSTNSWTLLDLVLPVKCNTNYFQDGFLFNGVLHWVCVGEKQEDEDCILRFDFRNNQFTTIDLPSEADDLSYNFAEINDSLAYVKNRHDPSNWGYYDVEIWTLEQDTSCWTKKHIFEPLYDLLSIYYFWKDAPELLGMCTRGNGEFYLVSYHPDGHIARRFEQITLHDRRLHDPVRKYVQSIAPLSLS
ncbi:PREDICTED: F-box only protein 8-like [Lupinus angustifolius]|nr:PREDICTED: F-box only protein 8-like [Lupinus angustifolius]